jgi:hypothetical protein
MINDDLRQIRDYVAESIAEIGVVSVDGEPSRNILWLSRVPQQYDSLYLVNVSPIFATYTMSGLFISRKRSYDVRIEGVNPLEETVVHVDPSQFAAYSIEPSIADRIVHGNTVYNVQKLTKMSASFVGGSFGLTRADDALLFRVVLTESNFAAQNTEYREKEDPNYTADKSLETFETNTSGVNTPLFTVFPASFKGVRVAPFEIEAGLNDLIKIQPGTFSAAILTIASGAYTSVTMASVLTAMFSVAFGASQIRAFTRDSKVGVETLAVASMATLILANVGQNAYVDFGWRIGTYLGREAIALVTNTFYSDGDPVNANG